ncbi:hypothetical protein BGX28_010389, partial [Mortierella sp. GBA30]
MPHRKRLQQERREEKVDQQIAKEEYEIWETAEHVVEQYELEQLAKLLQPESPGGNLQEAPRRRKGARRDEGSPDDYGPMGEEEAKLLEDNRRLKRENLALKRDLRKLKDRRYAPYSLRAPFENPYKRTQGSKVTEETRRGVLSCFEICAQEEPSRIVSTANPVLRTAHYLGTAAKTVNDILTGRISKDERGHYIRLKDNQPIFGPYFKNLAEEWNKKGSPVTRKKLRRGLDDFWGDTHKIPSLETIRKILKDMNIKYDLASKARNYIDTPEIKLKRRLYLKERYSAKYKDALFVWLDESYVNHHHVHNK